MKSSKRESDSADHVCEDVVPLDFWDKVEDFVEEQVDLLLTDLDDLDIEPIF
jgi:hypothetical protein